MKICSRCKRDLPLEGFGKHKTTKDGLQGQCRECRSAYQKKWYSQNSELHRARVAKVNDTHREQNRRFVWEYLEQHPCPCGESRPECLQFNHLDRSKKTFNISQGMCLSTDRLKEEIAKCEVLCANCHAFHTAKQMGYYAWRGQGSKSLS